MENSTSGKKELPEFESAVMRLAAEVDKYEKISGGLYDEVNRLDSFNVTILEEDKKIASSSGVLSELNDKIRKFQVLNTKTGDILNKLRTL